MADMSTTSQSAGSPGLGTNRYRTGIGDPSISIEIGAILNNGGGAQAGAVFAQADTEALANVAGFAASAGERGGFKGGHVDIQWGGLLTLPTEVWDARHGFSGGLEPNTIYYLSDTPGRMSSTPSVNFQVPLGFAVNATTFQIQIGAAFVPSP